jgi:hypothetical protein
LRNLIGFFFWEGFDGTPSVPHKPPSSYNQNSSQINVSTADRSSPPFRRKTGLASKLHPINKTLLKNELTLLPANLTHSELNSMLTEDLLEPEISMKLHSINKEYLQSLQVKGEGHCQFFCNKMSRQHHRQGLPCWNSLLFIATLMTELAKMHRAA